MNFQSLTSVVSGIVAATVLSACCHGKVTKSKSHGSAGMGGSTGPTTAGSSFPKKLPGANVSMSSSSANGLHAKDLSCKFSGVGFMDMLSGPSKVLTALSKDKEALKKCSKGEDVRVRFTMDGTKIVPGSVASSSSTTVSCVNRLLGKVKVPLKGECVMTFTFK